MKDIVSVITPLYNGAAHILDCVKSIRVAITNNKFKIEHVIVDDGSTDAGLDAIPMRYRSGISAHRLPANSGKPSIVRNYAIGMASGNIIFCLDHDDVLTQTALVYLYDSMVRSHSRVVYGDFLRADESLGYKTGSDYWGWDHETTQDLLYSIFKGDHFYQHSIMFAKDLWHEVGGYDTDITYGEDLDLCIRFILTGHRPLHTRTVTHLHRDHGNNLTSCYDHQGITWLAEHRAHYHKYQEQIQRMLTPAQITDIKKTLKITESTSLNGPPASRREFMLDKPDASEMVTIVAPPKNRPSQESPLQYDDRNS